MFKNFVLTMLTAAVFLSGCATMEDNPTLTRAVFEYATLKVIDGDAERADRVVDLMDDLMVLASGESTVELLDERLREQINWSSLSPADTILVNAVLEEVRMELDRQVGDGLLDPDQQLRVIEVLTWIRNAASWV